MYRVEDIWDETKKIVGFCDDEKLFRWIGDAASLIVNKADLEGLKGYLDICSSGCCHNDSGRCNTGCPSRCVTLPREVETVIGVNIEGRPALGFGQLFNFHQNGPGDCKNSCDWSWMDMGANWPTYRDIVRPSQLVLYLQRPEDNGKEFIVYGYDNLGNKLQRQVNGVWIEGYQLPTIYGVAVPELGAPFIARITSIYKQKSEGQIRLSTTDDSGQTGILLGVYEGDETLPQFRRIKLNRCCKWVRVAYLRTTPIFQSRYDHIPLKSRIGFLMAVRAVKAYADLQLDLAHAFEADAARMEVEAQMKLDAPLAFPIQVINRNNLKDNSDYCID